MNEDEQAAFQNILDCFSGTDGGGRFITFKCFLEHMSERSHKDADAKQLVEIMRQFSRMVDASNNR